MALDEFFGFEELSQVSHLPQAGRNQHAQLTEWPPEHSLISRLARRSEPFLTESLIILLLADLVDLVEELTNAKLQLGELFFAGQLVVVDRVLADLNVQMDSQIAAAKPSRRVRVETNDVLTGHVRREREATLGAVQLWQDDFLLGILDLDVHANSVWSRHVVICVLVEYLHFVLAYNQSLVGHLFDEALSLGFFDVKVEWVNEARLPHEHDCQTEGS